MTKDFVRAIYAALPKGPWYLRGQSEGTVTVQTADEEIELGKRPNWRRVPDDLREFHVSWNSSEGDLTYELGIIPDHGMYRVTISTPEDQRHTTRHEVHDAVYDVLSPALDLRAAYRQSKKN